jgi:hypothetical protein
MLNEFESLLEGRIKEKDEEITESTAKLVEALTNNDSNSFNISSCST